MDGTSPELKEHILCCEVNTGNDAQDPITTPSDGGGGGDDEGEKLTNPSVGIIQQGSESFASTDNINSSNSGNSDGDSSASSNSQEVTVFESSITNTFNSSGLTSIEEGGMEVLTMMPFSFVNSLWVLMARGWNYVRMQHVSILYACYVNDFHFTRPE